MAPASLRFEFFPWLILIAVRYLRNYFLFFVVGDGNDDGDDDDNDNAGGDDGDGDGDPREKISDEK